jgi:hypothetical protein
MKPFFETSIIKKRIIVLNAWELGLHDLENVVIKKGDQPIIPSNVNNAPILEVLKQRNNDCPTRCDY